MLLSIPKWLCINTGPRLGHFCSNQPGQLETGQWLSTWLPTLFAILTVLITWNRKTHPKSGPYLLVAAHIKRHGRRKHFVYLSLLSQVSWSTLLLRYSFARIWNYSRVPTDWCPVALQEPSRTPVSARDCWVTQPCGLNNYGILGLSSVELFGQYPVSQSNKCPFRCVDSTRSVCLENPD